MLEVLRVHIVKPTTIAYSEASGVKMCRKELKENARLLLQLQTLQENMSFRPMDMKEALAELAEEKKASWKLTSEEADDFSTTVGKRLRVMARHFQQAYIRKVKPRWLQDLVASAGCEAIAVALSGPPSERTRLKIKQQTEKLQPKDDDHDEKDEDSEARKVEWFVGWNSELGAAWRQAPNTSEAEREHTKVLVIPKGADDDDEMIARWSDGYEHKLPTLRVARFKVMKMQTEKQKGVLWRGYGFVVKEKKDRCQLLYLATEEAPTKQRLQLVKGKFAEASDGVELLAKVAKRMSEDAGCDPKAERDKLQAEYFATHEDKARKVSKKPSSASAAAAPTAAAQQQHEKQEEQQLQQEAASSSGAATTSEEVPFTPPAKRRQTAVQADFGIALDSGDMASLLESVEGLW